MEYKASVNKLTQPLVKYLVDNADKLRVSVETLENGCTIVDAGIKVPGGLEAGRIIAEICLGAWAQSLLITVLILITGRCQSMFIPEIRYWVAWAVNMRAGACHMRNITRWVQALHGQWPPS